MTAQARDRLPERRGREADAFRGVRATRIRTSGFWSLAHNSASVVEELDQLGEGIGFEEAPPPLIESRSKNYLTMAMEEVASGKIRHITPPS